MYICVLNLWLPYQIALGWHIQVIVGRTLFYMHNFNDVSITICFLSCNMPHRNMLSYHFLSVPRMVSLVELYCSNTCASKMSSTLGLISFTGYISPCVWSADHCITSWTQSSPSSWCHAWSYLSSSFLQSQARGWACHLQVWRFW